jgi:transposase
MSIVTIRIDIAKNIFSVHGVNERGKAELVKPKVSHDQLLMPCCFCLSTCYKKNSLKSRA